MFGGFGIYADGLMFALAADGVIYLKADEDTSGAFTREGMSPFTYSAKGRRRTSLSYWRLPDRLYDDPDGLAEWTRAALEAARRARAPKRATKKAQQARRVRKGA
jgi:DNA transformation protein